MLKRVLCALLALMMLAVLAPGLAEPSATLPTLAPAKVVNSSTNTGIDIVVVIDRSGTMLKTDPQSIALIATSTLANLSSTNGSQSGGVSMALVAYDYDVTTTPFYKVSDPQELKAFENEVNSCVIGENESRNDTNTGLALATAYKMIDDQRKDNPDHQFAVVLLSDGKIDIGDSPEFLAAAGLSESDRRNRTAAYQSAVEQSINQSIQAGQLAVDAMTADGIPLYCIGIYSSDQSLLGTNMHDWAVQTGSEDNYFITNDVDEVHDMMVDLLTRINDQATVARYQVRSGESVTIPVDEGVLQVNIQVQPKIDDINALSITSPSGIPFQQYTTEEHIGPAAGNSEPVTYTIIHMNQPPAGNYQLKIDDGQDYTYDLTIFSIFDLKLSLDGGATVPSGQPTTLRLVVTKDGNPYHDDSVGDPKLYIRTEDGAYDYTKYYATMTWDPNECCYYADFTPQASGVYFAQAQLVTNVGTNRSNERQINISNEPVRPKDGTNHAIEFTGHAITKYEEPGVPAPGYEPITLSYDELAADYFVNNSGLEIDDYRLNVADPTIASVEKDAANRCFVITPLAAGQTSFEIVAHFIGAETNESMPATGTILVEDCQAPVKVNDGAVAALEIEPIEDILPSEERVLVDDVNALFIEPNDIDGEQFTVSVLSVTDENGAETDAIEVRIVAGQLVAVGKSDVEAKVTLQAESYDASTAQLDLAVKVTNRLTLYLMIAGGALALLVLIIIIIIAVHAGNKPSFRRGATLTIELTTEDGSSVGVAMLQRYGKKAVKLSTVCSQNGVDMGRMRSTLDKILLLPRKKGGIVVRRNLKGGKKDTVLQPMDSWPLELDDDRMIELSYDEG